MTPVQVVAAESSPFDYTRADADPQPGTVPEQHEGPTPEQIADAEGSLAARVKAKAEKLKQRTKRIPIPPDDVWEGELVAVIRPIALEANMTFVKMIADATASIEMLDSTTGRFEVVEGAWVGLGRHMGIADDRVSVGEIIIAVCSSKEVMRGFAEQILAFITGRQSQVEQALGE